ncbi:MAG TPA: PEP-CTERM sorting domain-containing protein [Vicinamibacterales bacterium]|nr:PEP-CTERM sorting domain-containing protein [Vicinamibacterales bacterium]
MLVVVGLLAGAVSARASSVTVGAVTGINCAPFLCSPSFSVNRYQQVYSAGAFGTTDPLLITGLTFATVFGSGSFGDSTFAVSLSTTSASVQGLSFNMDDNVGADNALFWSGTLSGPVGPALSLSGGPFLYDPMAGNLLMDVTIAGGTAQYVFQSEDDSGTVTSRMFSNGTVYADEAGLVTEFTYTIQPPPAPVPEPTTLALLAAGLAGARRLKRRFPA